MRMITLQSTHLTFFLDVCIHFSGLSGLFCQYISFSQFSRCLGSHVCAAVTSGRLNQSLSSNHSPEAKALNLAWGARQMLAICDDPGKRAERNSFEVPQIQQRVSLRRLRGDADFICVEKTSAFNTRCTEPRDQLDEFSKQTLRKRSGADNRTSS